MIFLFKVESICWKEYHETDSLTSFKHFWDIDFYVFVLFIEMQVEKFFERWKKKLIISSETWTEFMQSLVIFLKINLNDFNHFSWSLLV